MAVQKRDAAENTEVEIQKMASEKERLIGILREKSLQVGEFRLTSGMTSYYYFDSKPTTLDPEGAYLSARLLLECIREEGLEAEAIGGMTTRSSLRRVSSASTSSLFVD